MRRFGFVGTQLTVLALALSLTACGGGSSGGSSRNFVPTPGAPAPGAQNPNNNQNPAPAPVQPNIAPSFDAVGDQTMNEDDAAQTVTISTITAGSPMEDALQLVTITASSSDPTIVPNPTISGTGPTRTFDLAPAADAFGSVIITLTAQDDGGTQNGGSDTFTQTFNVTVNSVNDAPSFDAIADQSVSTSAGPTDITINNVSGGPANESQNVTITASSDNGGVVPDPTVNGNVLTFTPTGTAGTANITVTAQDDDGTANGGVDTFVQTFAINVANANQGVIDTFTPNAGSNAGGTTITIATSGFGDDFTVTTPTVTVNGTTAAATPVDASTVTIDVPTGLASGAATVVVTDSTSTAQSTGFTIVDPVVAGDVFINEFMFDPNDGNTIFDSNNDGDPNSTADEFFEVANNRSTPVDITGLTFSDNTGVRHTFPNPTTLPGNSAIVVFGGGTPTGFNPLHSDGAAQVASTGTLSLGNGGETITLADAGGNTLDTVTYGAGGDGVSRNRSTDGDGTTAFDDHPNVNANGNRASPALRVDGTAFANGGGQQPGNASLDTVVPAAAVNAGATNITVSTSGFADDFTVTAPSVMFGNTPAANVVVVDPTTLTVTTPAVATGTVTVTVSSGADTATFTTFQFVDPVAAAEVFINEFMFDPNAGGGDIFDSNNDGALSSVDDEFVEFVNSRATPADISGFSFTDNTGTRHVFPNPTVIPAGGAIVVFGGGTPTGFPAAQTSGAAQLASTGTLSFGNGGETITLLDLGASTIDTQTYGAGGDGVSRNRATDGDSAAAFDDHDVITGTTRASPGTRVDGSPF